VAEGFNIEALRFALRGGRVEWNRHALERMAERGILRDEVKAVLFQREIVEEYPDDYPLPSALFFGKADHRVLHVVAAFDAESGNIFVITAYEPDADHFELDLRTRRKK
jgi:hypothetical protein